jgi:hypothetical protein
VKNPILQAIARAKARAAEVKFDETRAEELWQAAQAGCDDDNITVGKVKK